MFRLLLAASAASCLAWSGESDRMLFPIEQGGKAGFIDISGAVAVAPKYDQALAFRSGVAPVRVGDKWGYVDSGGRMVVAPRFKTLVPSFFCGDVVLYLNDDMSGMFVHKDGTSVQIKKWEKVGDCVDSHVSVRENRKWGLLSGQGKLVLPLEYDGLGLLAEGLIAAKQKGKWGYVDLSGKWIVEPKFDWADQFSEGLAPVRTGDYWGYADRTGRVVIRPAYSQTFPFRDGRGRFLTFGVDGAARAGFLDRDGRELIPPKYAVASDFSNGRAMVRIGDKYGFIGRDGQLAIAALYDWAVGFDGGLAMVKTFEDPKVPRIRYLNPAGTAIWDSARVTAAKAE